MNPIARPQGPRALETLAPAELPSWVGRSLRLTGVRAFDRQWDVRVEDSHVTVEEAQGLSPVGDCPSNRWRRAYGLLDSPLR